MPRLFLSHAWEHDTEGRDTHARVVKLSHDLRRRGWDVWLDVENLGCGFIDARLAKGIDSCDAVICLLTMAYIRKVSSCDLSAIDNCFKEFNYAAFRRKLLIPVIFEGSARAVGAWPSGTLALHFAGKMYIDCAQKSSAVCAQRITCALAIERFVPGRPHAESRVLPPLKGIPGLRRMSRIATF